MQLFKPLKLQTSSKPILKYRPCDLWGLQTLKAMAKSKLDSLTTRQQKFIIDSRKENRSFKDISEGLKTHFGISISHTSVKSWCDRNAEKIETEETTVLQLDAEFVDMFTPKDKSRVVTPFDLLRAKLLGLYNASLQRHVEDGTPVNTDYLKQAETLGRIEEKSYKEQTGSGKGTKSAFEKKSSWLDDFPLG